MSNELRIARENFILERLLDKAQDFFAAPANQEAFNEWLAKKEEANANHNHNGSHTRESDQN